MPPLHRRTASGRKWLCHSCACKAQEKDGQLSPTALFLGPQQCTQREWSPADFLYAQPFFSSYITHLVSKKAEASGSGLSHRPPQNLKYSGTGPSHLPAQNQKHSSHLVTAHAFFLSKSQSFRSNKVAPSPPPSLLHLSPQLPLDSGLFYCCLPCPHAGMPRALHTLHRALPLGAYILFFNTRSQILHGGLKLPL